MRIFVKILGVIEFIGAVLFVVIFFTNMSNPNNFYNLIVSITLVINGMVFMYIGSLGEDSEYFFDKISKLEAKIKALEQNNSQVEAKEE